MDNRLETFSSQTDTHVAYHSGVVKFRSDIALSLYAANQSLLQKNKSRRPESGLKDGL